jgi:hypothetical protein
VDTCFRMAMAGCGGVRVSEALAVFPFTVAPLMIVETAPLVLLYVPVADAVTSTLTVHVPPAAIVPPVKEMLVAPAVGANVGVPQPLVEAFGVLATTIPVGNVSAKATPLSALFWFGLVMTKVSVDGPGTRTGFGANCFVMLGGFNAVIEALPMPVAVLLAPDCVDDTALVTF